MNVFFKKDVHLYLQGATVLLFIIVIIFTFSLLNKIDSKGIENNESLPLEVTFLITPDCESCFPLDTFKDYLLENNLSKDQIKEVDYDSRKGEKILDQYSITKVPTIVIQGDNIKDESFVKQLRDAVGIGEFRQDAFIVTRLQPPYLDLEDGDIKGEFEVVYLDDSSCERCYDVEDHNIIFDRLAMIPSKRSTVDISSEEGKALIEEYVVTTVPTILIRGELEYYASLTEVWEFVGTKEEDGTYVLRKGVQDMGVYKRLPSEEIVEIETPQPNPTAPAE